MVLASDSVPAGTTLVTPALIHDKCAVDSTTLSRNIVSPTLIYLIPKNLISPKPNL